MTPYESDDLTTIIEKSGDGFSVLTSPASAEHDPDYKEIGSFPTRKQAEEFLAAR